MAVKLSKGQKVSLSKDLNGGNALGVIKMGLGWDTGSRDVDLDASCVLLGADKKLIDQVWFRQLKSKCGSVVHSGDNRTGAGDGDDESIRVDLSRISGDVHKIVISVTIHDAGPRRQNFGMVSNAFVRIVNEEGGKEVARYDLSEDASTETAMIFAEIYRAGTEWKFRAVGQGYKDGLGPLAKSLGVNV